MLQFIMLFGMMGLFNFIISMAVFNPYINRSFGEITIFSYICFILLLNLLASNNSINRILLFAGILYLINSSAGDAYILYKKSKDLSYKTINKKLSEITVSNKDIKVLTIIHLWFPFKDSEFYCKQTNFKYKNFDNWDDLLKNAGIDFVITSNLPVKGATGTSGRPEKVSGDELKFYNMSENYAEENGTLIKTIEGGSAYGLIKVYKIRGGGN
ncbi:MAG: hypothetical protein HC830_00605 [Bacteroidetes bacterium]|nr:hypothetical protein [Bacteroidota bacterium]